MENSPLDLSKPETPNPKPVTKLRSVRPRMPPRPSPGHVRRHDIHQTNRTLRRASGRPVGTTQDGTSDSDDAPETDAAADGFVNGSSAGRLARSCHAGDASNAPVRAAGTRAGRSSERRLPGARHRGVARILPRARRRAAESGGTGDGESGNGDRRLGRRDNGGDGGDGGDSVAMRVVRVGRRHQRHPPPVGRPRTGAGMATRDRFISRSLRTPASSRSDRRPDARRRK